MFRRVSRGKKTASVLGARMTYVEEGEGDPILFLHGNPTSSYLWRKVIPEVKHLGRCVAPDLVGMGDSEKVGSGIHSYRFVDHRTYVEAFIEVLGLNHNLVIVGHDWGGALGFDWAYHHQAGIKAIAYMETFVTPLTWDDWPEAARRIFSALRSPAGEDMILAKNAFVERILPASVLDPLPDQVMAEYRRPFASVGEDRRPTLMWPREIPIEGEPKAVHDLVVAYESWLREAQIPKLFINAEPGSILVGRQREVCRAWPNQTEATVRGLHFIQEDSGPEIGAAIANWLQTI